MQTNLAGSFSDKQYLNWVINTKETTAFVRKLSFLLCFSLFTILFSLFTNKLSFQRKDKREEKWYPLCG